MSVRGAHSKGAVLDSLHEHGGFSPDLHRPPLGCRDLRLRSQFLPGHCACQTATSAQVPGSTACLLADHGNHVVCLKSPLIEGAIKMCISAPAPALSAQGRQASRLCCALATAGPLSSGLNREKRPETAGAESLLHVNSCTPSHSAGRPTHSRLSPAPVHRARQTHLRSCRGATRRSSRT